MISNFQALKYFEVVARHEHFTKAANELYISQSTLSKNIDALEKEIGVVLFEKRGRNMYLTPYGKMLRDYVQRGVGEIDKGVKMIQSMSNEKSGMVRIATIYSAGSFMLPQYIKGCCEKHPDIRFKYSQKPTYRILDDLLSGDVEIGFCSNYEENEEYSSLHREEIMTEELCLIAHKDHPVAKRESVAFDELLEEVWIGYSGDTGMSTAIMDVVRGAGISKKLRFSYLASEDSAIIGLVQAGLGISIVPKDTKLPSDDIVKVKFSRPYLYRHIYMVWNSDYTLTPAAKAFRKYILSVD